MPANFEFELKLKPLLLAGWFCRLSVTWYLFCKDFEERVRTDDKNGLVRVYKVL